jgi:hypothetical protein
MIETPRTTRIVRTDRTLQVARVAARVHAELAKGMSVPDAIDAVLGAGTFAVIAGELYDDLRAIAAAKGAKLAPAVDGGR